jgi:hypothetical protein
MAPWHPIRVATPAGKDAEMSQGPSPTMGGKSRTPVPLLRTRVRPSAKWSGRQDLNLRPPGPQPELAVSRWV